MYPGRASQASKLYLFANKLWVFSLEFRDFGIYCILFLFKPSELDLQLHRFLHETLPL